MKYDRDDMALLKHDGWVFDGEDYIYIPNDEDGCMAAGEINIRYVIERIRNRVHREILEQE